MQYAWIKVLMVVMMFVGPPLLYASENSPLLPEKLALSADVIFKGICKEKKLETRVHPQSGREIPVDVYVFEIKEVIKGQVGSVFEVKQSGVRSRREAVRLGLGFAGGSRFEIGKKYLLFLTSPSSLLGFRFVVGDYNEGRLEIIKNTEGKEIILNRSYADFVSLVKGALRK